MPFGFIPWLGGAIQSYLPGLLSAGMRIGGGILDQNYNQWLQNAFTNQLNAADRAIDFSIDRYRENYDQLNPFLEYMMRYGPWQENMDWFGGQVRDSMEGLTPEAYRTPFLTLDEINAANNLEGVTGRVDPLYDFLYGNIASGGRNFDTQYLRDRLVDRIGVPDQLYDFGSRMIGLDGFNQYNLPSIEALNSALAAGGWSPQMNDVYRFGSGLLADTLGGGGVGNDLLGFGRGLVGASAWTPQMEMVSGLGRNLIDAAIRGDLSPEALQLMGRGDQLLNFALAGGMANDSGELQRRGGNLLDRADVLEGRTPELRRIDRNANDLFNAAFRSGGFINPEMDVVFNSALGLLGGGGAASNFQRLIGALGGGGGGASAGTASAVSGLIDPQDPTWLNRLQQTVGGLLSGEGSNVMGATLRASLAQDEAARGAARAFEAANRQALLRGGGPGAVVASGLANRGMGEFADEIAASEAAARRGALADYERARLEEVARALASAGQIAGEETSRYGIRQNAALQDAEQRNRVALANAANQTQASIANAQLANSFANNLAQLYSQLYGQQIGAGSDLLRTLIQQSGQNWLGGLQTALGAANEAARTGASRYGQELGTGADLLSNFGQQALQGRTSGADIALRGMATGADAAIRGRVAGLGTGADLLTTPLGVEANRYGANQNLAGDILRTGANLRNFDLGLGEQFMTDTLNLSPRMLDAYANIGGLGMADARARLGLGLEGMNLWNRNNLDYMRSLRDLSELENSLQLASMRMLPETMAAQGNLFRDIANIYGAGADRGILARTNFDRARQGALDLFGNQVLNPMRDNMWRAANIREQLARQWANVYGGLNQGRMNINPFGMTQRPGWGQVFQDIAGGLSNIPVIPRRNKTGGPVTGSA